MRDTKTARPFRNEPMDSDQKKPRPVTNLVPMLGRTFAVTRDGRKLDIRALPRPARKAPAEPVQLLLFPRRED